MDTPDLEIVRTTEHQRGRKELRLKSLGWCHPGRRDSLRSCSYSHLWLTVQRKWSVHWLKGMAEDYIFLLICFQPCLELLRALSLPRPLPKLVMPIHISVKIASLLQKVFLAAPPFLDHFPSIALPSLLHSKARAPLLLISRPPMGFKLPKCFVLASPQSLR